MIVIRGCKFKSIEGIALWPFVLVRTKSPSARLLLHERIHLRQQVEMLILPFYLWYITEWAWKWIRYRNTERAYFAIGFEREAYANDNNPGYLKTRRFWNFIPYIWSKKQEIRENNHH